MKHRRHVRSCVACGTLKQCEYLVHGAWACAICYRKQRYPEQTCPLCHRQKQLISRYEGQLVCTVCQRKRCGPLAACAQCGNLAHLIRGLCKPHYERQRRVANADRPRQYCPVCRWHVRHGRPCGCRANVASKRWVEQQLRALFGDGKQIVHPQLRRLYLHLTEFRDQGSVKRWLQRLAPTVERYVTYVRNGRRLRVADVVRLQSVCGGRELYASCLRAQIFTGLDLTDHLVVTLGGGLSPPLRNVLQRYWHKYLRREVVKRRSSHADAALRDDRTHLRVVAKLLQDVQAAGMRISDVTQELIDAQLARVPRYYGKYIARFCRWLRVQRLVPRPIAGPKGVHDGAPGCGRERYFRILYRARHDESLPIDVRVALLFIALARQSSSDVVCVRKTQVRRRGAYVAVQFPHAEWEFEGEVARLIRAFAGSAADWLFPSRWHFRGSLHPKELGVRVRDAGITINLTEFRVAAQREFLREHEPEELARAVGKSARFASRWRALRDASAAEIGRRLQRFKGPPAR